MGTHRGLAKLLPSKLCLLILLSCSVSDVFAKSTQDGLVAIVASWMAAFCTFLLFLFCMVHARQQYRRMNRVKENLSTKIREYAEHIGRKYNVTVHETFEGDHIYNHLTREELAALRGTAAAQSATAQDSTYDVLGSRNQTQAKENLHSDTACSSGPESQENPLRSSSSAQLVESGLAKPDASSAVATSANPTTPPSSRSSSQYTMVDLSVKKRKKTNQSELAKSGSEVQLCSDFVNDDNDGDAATEDLPLPPSIPEKLCLDMEDN